MKWPRSWLVPKLGPRDERECLDHLVVLSETHLRRILQAYAGYYNSIRTHRSLVKMPWRFARFSGSGPSHHTRSLAGSIIITFGFRFSVHTVPVAAGTCDASGFEQHRTHRVDRVGRASGPRSR